MHWNVWNLLVSVISLSHLNLMQQERVLCWNVQLFSFVMECAILQLCCLLKTFLMVGMCKSFLYWNGFLYVGMWTYFVYLMMFLCVGICNSFLFFCLDMYCIASYHYIYYYLLIIIIILSYSWLDMKKERKKERKKRKKERKI